MIVKIVILVLVFHLDYLDLILWQEKFGSQ